MRIPDWIVDVLTARRMRADQLLMTDNRLVAVRVLLDLRDIFRDSPTARMEIDELIRRMTR
mgnify:CR=1 FL=1